MRDGRGPPLPFRKHSAGRSDVKANPARLAERAATRARSANYTSIQTCQTGFVHIRR